eukprot:TRINITY_DN15432_c0_g1_i1.p3 TRINITY_DN15432_c0_g1~~TRINITY_DN15432_c0_g1_i1.p3  ORF type:complete len:101 (-),score=4.13 TRINITY_DN15432_c0_g1_i1:485-787(-)
MMVMQSNASGEMQTPEFAYTSDAGSNPLVWIPRISKTPLAFSTHKGAPDIPLQVSHLWQNMPGSLPLEHASIFTSMHTEQYICALYIRSKSAGQPAKKNS